MTLRNRAFGHLGAVAAMSALAAACTSPTPAPAPAEPTQSSPAASSIPPETKLERQTRLDFEAAEKAYRSFRVEYDLAASRGGLSKPTRKMSENAAGPYLKVMTGFLAQTKAKHKRQRGVVRIAYVRRGAMGTSVANLSTCEDGSRVRNVDKHGRVLSGGISVEYELTVRKVHNEWKVWDGNDHEVQSCGA